MGPAQLRFAVGVAGKLISLEVEFNVTPVQRYFGFR